MTGGPATRAGAGTAQQIETDVAVVGGGSAGCVVAGRLAERGRNVVLLEAGPDYGPLTGGRWPTDLIDARRIATTREHQPPGDHGGRARGRHVVNGRRVRERS